ncbi:MAG: hypothetical protein AAGF67_10440, partial [Verrucomicrobiota bacterium]
QEIEGIRFSYPSNQEDLLELLLPQITLLRDLRRSSAATEVAAFRELLDSKKAETATLIEALLGVEGLNSDFSACYDETVLELNKILDHWESWAGDLSEVRLHDRESAAGYWRAGASILDFGHIQYSFTNTGNVNLSILPPFVNRIGAGIEKLNPDYVGNEGFAWDIGLLAPPGTSAEAVADEVSTLIPVLTDLQHEVALQLGTRWTRYYLIERLLRAEISARWFLDNPETEVLVNGLARLYLDHFIRLSEPERVAVLFPNLVHFPVAQSPGKKLRAFFEEVETLDPFGSLEAEEEVAASRVLMLGLLKSSQSVEGGELPLQRFASLGLNVPEGGFDLSEFSKAIAIAYPDCEPLFSEAAQEVSLLMQKNALHANAAAQEREDSNSTLPAPPHYQEHKFDDLIVQAPDSLIPALQQLAPEWSKELKLTAEILRKRFENHAEPLLSFDENDYLSLRSYGIDVTEEEVARWIEQTRLDQQLERAFLALFDHLRVEVWFEEDLARSLREVGNTGQYSLDPNTGKVSVNFALSAEDESPRSEAKRSSPSFPIVVRDSNVANLEVESQIAALREGDLLIHHLTSEPTDFSMAESSRDEKQILNEEDSFFIVVHEVVEGYLIQNVIGSPDRRWFCDGLANWIAIQECDRRFGTGTGNRIFEKMFPNGTGSTRETTDLLSWKALEYANSQPFSTVAEHEGALYAQATGAMTEALEGKNAPFVTSWLEKIRETNWIRTNGGTAISAYDELSGGNLRSLLQSGGRKAEVSSPLE